MNWTWGGGLGTIAATTVTRIFVSWGSGDSPLISGLNVPLAITDHDPSFSVEAFVPFAQAVFLRVNRARAEGKLDDVRRLLADGQWQEFQAEGTAPQRGGLTVSSAQVLVAGQDGSWDTVVVRFTAREPGRRGRTLVEDWTFQRPVAPAQPAESGDGEECPVCGAPLSLNDDGTCRYCGSAARGGLGGWRLVRAAPGQPAASPLDASSTSISRWSGRAGCALAAGITVLALLPVGLALVSTGLALGFVHRTLTQVPVAGSGLAPSVTEGRLSGQGSFSGAVNGDTEGTVLYVGAGGGSCASKVKHLSGVTFTDVENSDGGRKVLATRVTLPPGVEGPGTYDLSRTPLQVSANYAFNPDTPGGSSQPEGQVWQAQPGQTSAVLVIRPDGSGSLTVTGLAPGVPQAAGNSLGDPLHFTESFSCS